MYFVVAFLDSKNRRLVQYKVKANTWKGAYKQGLKIYMPALRDLEAQEYIDYLPNDMEEAQERAFGTGYDFSCIQI